jgi:hypothetical protein
MDALAQFYMFKENAPVLSVWMTVAFSEGHAFCREHRRPIEFHHLDLEILLDIEMQGKHMVTAPWQPLAHSVLSSDLFTRVFETRCLL